MTFRTIIWAEGGRIVGVVGSGRGKAEEWWDRR